MTNPWKYLPLEGPEADWQKQIQTIDQLRAVETKWRMEQLTAREKINTNNIKEVKASSQAFVAGVRAFNQVRKRLGLSFVPRSSWGG